MKRKNKNVNLNLDLRSILMASVMALATTACSADTDSKPAAPPAPKAPATPPATKPVEAAPSVINFDSTDMTIKGKAFKMEVADSQDKIERGLMYRDSMADDHGMIFVFPEPQDPDRAKFWMKNTRIPLDIIFLDKDGRVLVIHQRRPFDETGMGPDTPALYVIELNVGMAAKLGLKRGDTVEIPKKYVKGGTNPTDK